MMERITRKDVERAFALAFSDEERASDFGKDGSNAHNVGRYALDYAACYGGHTVIMFAGGDSGAGWRHGTPPWGHQPRRPSREMVAWLDGIRAARLTAREQAYHG